MNQTMLLHSGGQIQIYTIDVADLGLQEGTNKITAVITANGYADSNPSNEVVITVSDSSHSG